jgi:MarR family transcriptional regulator, transcriptional regulator for hemolysin
MQEPPISARFGQQLGVVSTLYRGLIERFLSPHDLTWAQFSLLLHLARRAGPGGISEMAVAVELTQSAVTKVVQKFVAQGLVEILRDDHDARNRLVRITPVGIVRLQAVQQSFGPVFDDLLAGWRIDELERLIADLTRLTTKLNALKRPERTRQRSS